MRGGSDWYPCPTAFIRLTLNVHLIQVWPWDIASDGVEMRNFVPHGTQVFLVRCAAVPETLLCKSRNVKPILIIPGPSAPKSFGPYWKLILDLFDAASPLGGMSLAVH